MLHATAIINTSPFQNGDAINSKAHKFLSSQRLVFIFFGLIHNFVDKSTRRKQTDTLQLLYFKEIPTVIFIILPQTRSSFENLLKPFFYIFVSSNNVLF